MGTKTVSNGQWCAVVASLVREVKELKLERLAAASTTTTDRLLGQVGTCAHCCSHSYLWLGMSV